MDGLRERTLPALSLWRRQASRSLVKDSMSGAEGLVSAMSKVV